jgi:hypothetical protein
LSSNLPNILEGLNTYLPFSKLFEEIELFINFLNLS